MSTVPSAISPVVARQTIRVLDHEGSQLTGRLSRWQAEFLRPWEASRCHDPAWLDVLARSMGHEPHCLEAVDQDGTTRGLLPLALVRSVLFGKFLVSLPYLNSAGVLAADKEAAGALLDAAVALADRNDVRYLELRHETAREHPALTQQMTSKVHMRLPLPTTSDDLWQSFKPKVRNQIRKGETQGLTVHWGGRELLTDFYAVFCRNMRDLGTPVYGRSLFAEILTRFAGDAELCVLRLESQPVAAALLVHGRGVTEVPSASSLREFNSSNANMLMYWRLLQRAIERQQRVFDFGRSTEDCNTFRFKKQWGARPEPAIWQYYVRKGSVGQMRPENGKYRRAVQIWQRLPVTLTRWIGPQIVRGIP